ncbi:hypothetical protein ACE3MS_31205 [Paenibacillus dendritiformis]|uniref:hypothetical protein n=1 Tax=Paenibacillus dendritiformis TaxID=130049 RepID=UPI003647F19E
MLYAIKGNKQLKIEEAEKQTYLNMGYDIAKANDNQLDVIAVSPSKTVPYAEYKKLQDELEELKAGGGAQAENEELKVRYGAAQSEIKALRKKLTELEQGEKTKGDK